MAVNCCGGVPKENCITYSPLPTDTGLSKTSVSAAVRFWSFCSSCLMRLWLRFTASRTLSPRGLADGLFCRPSLCVSVRESTLWQLQLSITKDADPSVALTNTQKLNENESTQHNVPRYDAHFMKYKMPR